MDIDIIIIGLNSAATIRQCIDSARASDYSRGSVRVCYVDSGSTDDSLALAEELLGTSNVLQLETGSPTPGAARNLGWKAGRAPLVQFIDSDTCLFPDWLDKAVDSLGDDGVGAVFGNRTESSPGDSVYNWIANLEWNSSPGASDSFGGDVLVRREILEETGGYDEELVGGEDPELSQRVRQAGWQILHLDEAMTTHDIAMVSVRQYWKRAYRTGYAYAAVALRHGFKNSAFWRYELGRILVRGGAGLGLFFAALPAAIFSPILGLVLCLSSLALLLYPRLFRVNHFQRTKDLSRQDARTYAWHCALVIIPEFFGVLRYVAGHVTHRPLRNGRRPSGLRTITSQLAILIAAGFLSGCSSKFETGVHEISSKFPRPAEELNVGGVFEQEVAKEAQTFATEDEIKRFSDSVPDEYRIGPGDKMAVLVRDRPDSSLPSATVSPDGLIAVPRVGTITVKDRTAEEITDEIRSRLKKFYAEPEVTVLVSEYNNNKAFVLGRVSNPGLVEFKGRGTLLEALSMAGGLPTNAQDAFLSRAMIFRGNDMVIWVDLREILTNGNVAMNPRLRNNDVVFIPESDDELVFVMGEVVSPGAVKLKTELSLLDAVMASGGPTKDAKLASVYLIRYEGKRSYVQQIRVDNFLERGDLRQDYLLQDGDIVYVSTKSIEKISYVLSKFSPALRYLDLALISAF